MKTKVCTERCNEHSTPLCGVVSGRPQDGGTGIPTVPQGRNENSPALQCRGLTGNPECSPIGTAELSSALSVVPMGLLQLINSIPGTEVPGYSQGVPMGRVTQRWSLT